MADIFRSCSVLIASSVFVFISLSNIELPLDIFTSSVLLDIVDPVDMLELF